MRAEPPGGLTHRHLTHGDAQGVFELMAAEQQQVLGRVDIELADIVGDWARPSHDLATQSVGVLDDDRLVGYAEVIGQGRGDAAVHPALHGRGIGTWLAHWMQDRAREQGQTEIGMPVPAGSPGETLLTGLGYHLRWHSWVLVMPEGREIEDRPLPPGHALRLAESEDERRAVHHVVEDAFLEWSTRDKEPFTDWIAGVVDRPGFEPWNLRMVVDPEGVVVGGVHVVLSEDTGFVSKLAVRRDRRGQGLARALLVDAFRAARAHGATRSELSTDSRTGALGLYLGIGMEVSDTWVNLGIRLD